MTKGFHVDLCFFFLYFIMLLWDEKNFNSLFGWAGWSFFSLAAYILPTNLEAFLGGGGGGGGGGGVCCLARQGIMRSRLSSVIWLIWQTFARLNLTQSEKTRCKVVLLPSCYTTDLNETAYKYHSLLIIKKSYQPSFLKLF